MSEKKYGMFMKDLEKKQKFQADASEHVDGWERSLIKAQQSILMARDDGDLSMLSDAIAQIDRVLKAFDKFRLFQKG